jgi:ribose 5-phosphate isomerase A
MNNELLKKSAAEEAIKYLQDGSVIGVGTGSTVKYFIEALSISNNKHSISGVVASSKKTAELLKKVTIPMMDLNSVNEVSIYIDD